MFKDRGILVDGALFLCTSAFLAVMALNGDDIREIDAVVFNFLSAPDILRQDTVFFDPHYYAPENVYFFPHRIIVWLAKSLSLAPSLVAGWVAVVALAVAVAGALYLVETFSRSILAKLAVLLALIFNVNFINLGATDFLPWFYLPHNLAIGAAFFSLTSFLRGRHNAAMLLLGAVFWLHLPTAVFLGLPMGLALLLTCGPCQLVLRHWRGLAGFAALFLPFAILLLGTIQNAAITPAPAWVAEIAKQATYSHISLLYRFYNLGILHSAATLAAAIAVVVLAHAAWRTADEGRERDRFGRVFAFIAAAWAATLLYAIGVDLFEVTALYPLALLRICLFPGVLALVLLAATAGRLRVVTGTGRRRYLVMAWLLLAAIASAFALRHLPDYLSAIPAALASPDDRDSAWIDIAEAADQTPPSSVILVPYERVDFYRYAHRLSPFSRLYPGHLLSSRHAYAEIERRFDDFVAPGFLPRIAESVHADPASLRRAHIDEVLAAWDHLTPADLERLQRQYGLTHVIHERQRAFPGEIVVENRYYVLRRLPSGGN